MLTVEQLLLEIFFEIFESSAQNKGLKRCLKNSLSLAMFFIEF